VLQTIQLDLEPFAELWLTSMEFKLALPDWKFGPFLQLNAEDVQVILLQHCCPVLCHRMNCSAQTKMSSWTRTCSKLERIFSDSDAPLTACTALKR
jgi:hypothetical protein